MSKEKTIKIFNKIDELSAFFGNIIVEKLQKKTDDEYFTIALSGGSTPKYIFQYLAKNFREKINWNRILVFWGDERCVQPDDEESNYKMACDFLLNRVNIPQENIFRIFGESNPDDEAVRYSELIKSKLSLNKSFPTFDLVFLGLGDDGHTASIFQNNLNLFKTTKLFDVAIHPKTKQKRITASGTLINFAKTIVFIVTGKAKAEVVSSILNKDGIWEKLPASHVKPKNGKLIWLLDKDAASVFLETPN